MTGSAAANLLIKSLGGPVPPSYNPPLTRLLILLLLLLVLVSPLVHLPLLQHVLLLQGAFLHLLHLLFLLQLPNVSLRPAPNQFNSDAEIFSRLLTNWGLRQPNRCDKEIFSASVLQPHIKNLQPLNFSSEATQFNLVLTMEKWSAVLCQSFEM